ncbi:dual oxidase [Frankliniella occidentalis]|uniref:NAD(P)H oxidase (H2O2-forming) n=1 Tax=Frankliniella occidentalis TaxID=133901 RepID=A0A9C6X0D9_FRAOC|nr:dual oxidase [Frankliniella occidentalis]
MDDDDRKFSYTEKQRYDGWFNNLGHPSWGAVESRLTRKAPSAYSDGVYMLAGMHRPSPRRLSQVFMRGADGQASSRNRTALLAFFGQVVSSEVVMASESGCPIEMHRIEVDRCDEVYDKECKGGRFIPFHRASYDRSTGISPNSPREQLNRATSWIDGSFVYSTSEAWAAALRSYRNGSFKTEAGGRLPVRNTMRVPLFNSPAPNLLRTGNPERLFLLGDPRTNQNPALLSFGILFHRWHNVQAARVQRQHPTWPDEEVFERARRLVIASMQNVIMYEYLPAFLGQSIPPYDGYKPDVHPGVSHAFQSAAFRFGHTLIPPGIYRRDGQCHFRPTNSGFPALRLCSTWWDSNVIEDKFIVDSAFLLQVRFGPEVAMHTVDRKGDKLRTISFANVDSLTVEESVCTGLGSGSKPLVLVRVPRDHDLVLEFDSLAARRKFVSKMEAFLAMQKKHLVTVQGTREQMLANAETRERRQKRLEHFFREAYGLTFGIKPGDKRKRFQETGENGEVVTVMRTSLSKSEFASALGMRPDAVFVRMMFNIVDKDGDGRISFQEFLDTVVLFSRGKTEDKLRIVFDMCDNDRNGVIDKGELSEMLRSLVDIARTNSLSDQQVTELIDGMFQDAGLQHKDYLTYNDFKLMMKEYKGDFVAIGLDCKGAKQNFLDTSTNVARMTSFHIEPMHDERRHWLLRKWDCITTFLEENRQNIFYLLLFYVITIVLFVERFIHYSFLAEHTDLRHIMGVGIAITRGSAASLSFCYSLLLLTMSRNLLTKLKEFSIQQYIPLDAHIQFHKIAACTALFFSLLHTVGHIVNFYHVSTQPLDHLHCLTSEVHFPSDYKPGITFWLFQTITGLTGVMLFVVMIVIFVFAHPIIRKKAYKFFWSAHSLYVLLYVLCLIHGLARLTGVPRFWIYFIGPGIVYTLDKVVSLRTKYMALDVIETELLPSDVIKVKFYRPPNFKYLSGQWVRLACTAFRAEEFHSFTLTSAPHENFLSCHIKAQGPWTWKLRNYFDPCNFNPEEDHPKIRLEGPFGGGNQDWYKFEVAVMVGGGIGVTPYASILNDLVFGTSTNRYSGVACKKVYFLWICPSHRHFEWFIEVLRDVERKDVTNVLEIHIFITQFFHKFDLRTTMLYICENHFQRLSKTSMFTGLKAVNHFGRPDMSSFLKFVQKKHSYVSKIGVFSCGPRPLTKSIMAACEEVNKGRKLPYFIHHFENFG